MQSGQFDSVSDWVLEQIPTGWLDILRTRVPMSHAHCYISMQKVVPDKRGTAHCAHLNFVCKEAYPMEPYSIDISIECHRLLDEGLA